MMHYKKYMMIFFFFTCIWCTGIISPVIFHGEKAFYIVKPFLNQMYSTVCHQAHEKTIRIDGENLLVCSRCAGIYLGFLLIGLCSLLISKVSVISLPFLLVASAFMLFDVLFTSFNVYDYSKIVALITGLFFGSTIILFFLNELKKLNQLNYNEK